MKQIPQTNPEKAGLNSELPRKISLALLVQALVEDYQDTNQPVALIESLPIEASAERSIFASRSGSIAIAETSKILMYARPVALRRAVSNLIDNALKYGRRATVSVSFDANWATVMVETKVAEALHPIWSACWSHSNVAKIHTISRVMG